MRQVLVFAYGSNLDARRMHSRCASARIEARAVLPNHALAVGGQRWDGAVASVVSPRLSQLAYFRVLLNAYSRLGAGVERLAAAVGVAS